MNASKIFNALELTLEDRQEDLVALCKAWYMGNVKDFHNYMDSQGSVMGSIKRERATLGMAKVVVERWADVIWNPETFVVAGDEERQKWIDDKLEYLDFTNKMNNLVELYMALGNGATVQYVDERKKSQTSFVTQENIYPLSFDNGTVTSCAFLSAKVIDGEEYAYITIHEKQEDDMYKIRTILMQENEQGEYEEVNLVDSNGNEILIKEQLSKFKQFQIYKPAIGNNKNIGNPMGISVYANAIEELKSVDIAFDALRKEIKNGRMRIYLRESALTTEINGEETKIVNPDQDEFYILNNDSTTEDGTFIHVQAPTLRVESLINGLNKACNLLGSKCGLGDNQFASDQGTIYTNTTQVVSTNSTFFKTRIKHCSIVEHNIIEMIETLYFLETNQEINTTISVQFDDSIIHDKDADQARDILLFNLGLLSKVQLSERVFNLTREEAEQHMEQLISDEGITEEIETEEFPEGEE